MLYLEFLRRYFYQFLLCVAGCFITTIASAQTVRYVKPNGTGDASSWSNASGDLQAVINSSAPGDQVWVAAGTYKPGGNSNTDRLISFTLKNGVALYGGFSGTEVAVTERPSSIAQNQPSTTILSGDLGQINDRVDNSQHIIVNRDLNNSALVDGFVITAAFVVYQDSDPNYGGGGMYNINSSPTIRNCYFTNNESGAFGRGIGLYNDLSSTPVISNCTFDKNSGGYGSAIWSGPISLTNCVFSYNTSYGANLSIAGSATLTNCTFNNNVGNSGPSGAAAGGAVYVGDNSTLIGCLFAANYAVGDGGALRASNSIVTNCTFRGNTSSSGGAGIVDSYGGAVTCSNTTFTNCSFTNNRANARGQSFGGAVSSFKGRFINCSFSANKAQQSGGSVYGTNDVFANCIIWGNTPDGIYAREGVSMTFTDTQDQTVGTGNISLDPLFVDASGDNLRLSACSPAIDKGDNAANTSSTDLNGTARQIRQIDLGAYEFRATPLTLVAITQSPEAVYSIPQGGTLTATVSATGSVTGYQWYKNGSPITEVASARSATLTISNLTPADTGRYYVVVTGNCNSVASNPSLVIVNTGMYTVKAGNWNDASIWSLNRLPVNGESVRIKHLVTVPANYSTQSQRISYDPKQRISIQPGGRIQLNRM